MGSQSDWPIMKHASNMLTNLSIKHERKIVSAHRTPDLLFEYAESAEERGLEIIIAGAGALKQILVDSGVSDYIGKLLEMTDFSPLILGWLTATLIRFSVGSATVAGLTTAAIVLPLVQSNAVNPELMVLAIGLSLIHI